MPHINTSTQEKMATLIARFKLRALARGCTTPMDFLQMYWTDEDKFLLIEFVHIVHVASCEADSADQRYNG